MNDTDRFISKIKKSTANPKYRPGHTQHTDDCMSPWGENSRGIMSPETIAENHKLHMADPEYVNPEIVACPSCGADANSKCVLVTDNGRQPLKWHHPERETRARLTNG